MRITIDIKDWDSETRQVFDDTDHTGEAIEYLAHYDRLHPGTIWVEDHNLNHVYDATVTGDTDEYGLAVGDTWDEIIAELADIHDEDGRTIHGPIPFIPAVA